MRSLTFKLVFSFWLVSLVGITFGVLFAGQVSFREIGDLADSQQMQVLVARLESYYQVNGSWKGVSLNDFPQNKVDDPGVPGWKVVLTDPQGNIVASTDRHLQNVALPHEELEHGQKLTVNDEAVGVLVFGPWLPEMRPLPTTAIFERVARSLLVGGVAASAMSLLLGWILARSFIRPIHALNVATQSVAQGDFETPVPVKSKDEIGMLANSFNEMITRLKRARDQRRQMTADIAHELRTPLSLILGHTEAMSDGVLPSTPESLSIVYDEAQRLARLVEDLRTLSLSEAGEISLSPGPLAPGELLASLADAYRSQAAQHGLTLEIHVSPNLPVIYADPDRLGQILRNLLDNALRFTPANNGRVALSVSPAQGGVEFCIQDSGPGISPDDLPHIFDRFYRGDKARNRQDGGSGLGLAIVRSLVELHGGKIWVESEVGMGAKFVFWLPAFIPS